MTAALDVLDQEMAEFLLESYGGSAFFAKEDLGWTKIGELGDVEVIPREFLVTQARLARIMSVRDPLIRRLVSLKTAYLFGQGVTIQADQEEDSDQDLNAVIQNFLDDDSNKASFSTPAAREEMERILETDGNIFHALPTDRQTGRVQVRRIPFRQVVDIITDPEDQDSPWFYKREWTTIIVEPSFSGVTTRSRRETRRVLYPDVRFRPNRRPKQIDGIPVEWDTPILHTRVNRVDGGKWGIADLVAALPWAEGYKGFLEDWAKLVKALSRYAFRSTSRGRAAATVRDRINSTPSDTVGATVSMGENQKFEAIGKSGATIDSESGRPLAAMVAASGDVPVTMLLGDPGVTGARATAETLDQPMRLGIMARQTLHGEMYLAVLNYVIDQSIKASLGELKGTVRIDRVTGREIVELANEQARTIRVTWPDLEEESLEVAMEAIVKANDTGLLPELTIIDWILRAFKVADPDEITAKLVDDQGNFVPPRGETDDRAGAAAAEAIRRGEDASVYV